MFRLNRVQIIHVYKVSIIYIHMCTYDSIIWVYIWKEPCYTYEKSRIHAKWAVYSYVHSRVVLQIFFYTVFGVFILFRLCSSVEFKLYTDRFSAADYTYEKSRVHTYEKSRMHVKRAVYSYVHSRVLLQIFGCRSYIWKEPCYTYEKSRVTHMKRAVYIWKEPYIHMRTHDSRWRFSAAGFLLQIIHMKRAVLYIWKEPYTYEKSRIFICALMSLATDFRLHIFLVFVLNLGYAYMQNSNYIYIHMCTHESCCRFSAADYTHEKSRVHTYEKSRMHVKRAVYSYVHSWVLLQIFCCRFSSLPLCLSVSLSLCLSFSLSLCPPVSLSPCLSVPLSLCPSVSLFLCLSVSLSLCFSVSLHLYTHIKCGGGQRE